MASWQARQRDPLLDQNTQAMLERRGRELMGIALLVVAFGFFLLDPDHHRRQGRLVAAGAVLRLGGALCQPSWR
jgi:hypothetical protein